MANIGITVKTLKAKSEPTAATSQRYPSTCRMAKTKIMLTVKSKALFDFLDEKSNRL
jgi:hypothetical protein